MTDPSPLSTPRQTWLATLGWAAFLAASWTWCIGMFLPVLLVRDFGAWGFVVFAVPNVIGAAAMGWVLRRSRDSTAIVQAHRPALAAFSIVTITFQCFFAVMVLSRFANFFDELQALPYALFFVTSLAAFSRGGKWAAAAALLASLTLFALYLSAASWPAISRWPVHGPLLTGVTPQPTSLVWLAPVTCFGFLLCPYLDLTFHRARTSLDPVRSRIAFGVGFGVMFLAMILFTLLYCGEFFDRPLSSDRKALAFVLVHITLQLGVTVGLHAHSIARLPRSHWRSLGLVVTALAIAAVAVLALPVSGKLRGLARMAIDPSFEDGYRLFMSFYGLIFPAYVWLCMIPVRGETGTQPPSIAKLRAFAIAVALAAPCFWMGFIERQTWWLGPGLFIVLAARAMLPRAKAGGPAPRTD